MRITRRIEALLLAPLGLLLLSALLIPAGILFYYSFYRFAFFETYGPAGLGNYSDVFSDPLYRTITVNTLAIAIPTVLVSVTCGYSLAYYLVFGRSRLRGLLFMLVLTALMASYLVRIYAWRTLLGETGIVNTLLSSAGVIDEPLSFLLFTRTSAIIAEVNLFIPLAALTFYAALSGVSGDFKEAARDLGAGPVQTLRRVTLPLTGSAILITTAVIFFLSCGDYITPLLVGGVRSQTVGMDVATSFGQSADYGRGAAVSFLIVLGFVAVFAVLAATLRASRLLPRAH